MKQILNAIIGIFICFSANAGEIDDLIHQLDNVIANRETYVAEREHSIDSLRSRLRLERDGEARFSTLGDLYSVYTGFNTDSMLAMARKRMDVAQGLGVGHYIDNARLNLAEGLYTTGMYKEALDCINKVDRSHLPEYLLPYYYHICRTIYGYMSDFVVGGEEDKSRYDRLTHVYRDSILLVNAPETSTYLVVLIDKLNESGEYDEAIRLVENSFQDFYGYSVHERAIIAYTLSESYGAKGDVEKQKKYLVISAIADMQSAVKEYISLRKLAVLLYREGDIDRAYSYLRLCMEDASVSNARLRMVEIQKIFPVINDVYQEHKQEQQARLKLMLALVGVLSLVLMVALFGLYKAMRKKAQARKQVEEANCKLRSLNDELHEINGKLKETNRSLLETTYLKETYIGKYMDECSSYIEKLDAYRKSLSKIAMSGKMADLCDKIKSTQFIDDELKGFYANFDDTFLSLFPTFVDEFNGLLKEKVVLKPTQRMNTELRIFALVRLGITDSVKIAQFLRYSVTTIYNYRTKTRNKAAGNREDFERQVANIGKEQNMLEK